MILGILPVQFTCLTVCFRNLSPSFLSSTSWPGTLHFMLHTFLHQIIASFCGTCPYHRNLFCCSTEIMSSNPSLSLNPLLGTLSGSLMPHIHLTILPAEVFIHFPFLWARSHFHATLHTTAVQSPSHFQ